MKDDCENCTEIENIQPALCEKKILQVLYRDHVTNEEILHRAGSRKQADVMKCRFHTAGHLQKMLTKSPAGHSSNDMDYGRWQAKKGCPKMTWRKTM